MTQMERIRDFLGLKRLALVGVSRRTGDFSRILLRELQARGYDTVPVNPEVAHVDGARCYARLSEIQPPVEGALLMTPPAATDTLVEECAAAGITRIWMFRGGGHGAVSPQAVQYCEAHGISVIPGECPFMFLKGSGWIHSVHGFVRKIGGSYPR